MKDNKEYLSFGDFVRKKRLENNLTLRKFCKKTGYDPAYISRIENNLLPPPESTKKLKTLATALELEKETENWVKFFNLAAAQRKEAIPADIEGEFPEIERFLPAFYRTLRKKKISNKDIKQLLELFNNNETAK